MTELRLGVDRETGEEVRLPVDCFRTHLHMPGATGKGKSTAILTLLEQLLLDWRQPTCHVVVDFLGGLTSDLLLWMSSRWCTPQVRDRLVLLRPSDPRVTTTLNPLLYDDRDQGFYKVNRAAELILRAWSAQDLADQPRLARWLFNAMWACAQLGLTVADTQHLLVPGSPFHEPLLSALPLRLRAEWHEVLTARGGEATRILDSTRNRLKPFHESGVLSRLFGSARNRLDAAQMMRERKVLLLDLSPGKDRLSPPEANAIAGLVVNEFLAAARSAPEGRRHPTFLWLDEFQRLVSPDLEYAIPEMRQLQVRLVLAHQSFSQLQTETADLTSLIWQPQTRLAFGEQGEDADLLGQEFASLSYDPKRIKQEIHSLRQLQSGHEKVQLSSWASGQTDSNNWQSSTGSTASDGDSLARRTGIDNPVRGEQHSRGRSSNEGEGGGQSRTSTQTTHEQLIAKLETIRELSSREFYSFEDQRQIWAQRVRQLRTGQCLLRLVNDARVRDVMVDDPRHGMLGLPFEVLERRFPQVIEARERLVTVNFAQDLFVTPAEVDREAEERLRLALRPPIVLRTAVEDAPEPGTGHNPFAD